MRADADAYCRFGGLSIQDSLIPLFGISNQRESQDFFDDREEPCQPSILILLQVSRD